MSPPSIVAALTLSTLWLLVHLQAPSARAETAEPSVSAELIAPAQIKALAQQISLLEVSGYQQRRGEQRIGYSGISSGSAHIFHRALNLGWRGTVESQFDGRLSGLQLNRNFYASPTCRGSQELGLFAGTSKARGDTFGGISKGADFDGGRIELTSYYGGVYFSDYRHDLSYLDVVAKVGYVTASMQPPSASRSRVTGPQLTLSAERGFVLSFSPTWKLEPQAQLVANYTSFGTVQALTGPVGIDKTPEVSFRGGLRGYPSQSAFELYLFANLWHTLRGEDDLKLQEGPRERIQRGVTWGEFGGGVTLLDSAVGSVFLNASYRRSGNRENWSGGGANLGFNWRW
ncbi:autotransporter outer membrane beta-barrel domain-containing protein [Microbulbifer discodermiae]|uniref:autotransporter outer membrane beta-barrel domain-containing protein n=1 Tax=Microbulbifer sp. 2201CG32-9 TaxID=3232309 RepID=UPI00345BC5C2